MVSSSDDVGNAGKCNNRAPNDNYNNSNSNGKQCLFALFLFVIFQRNSCCVCGRCSSLVARSVICNHSSNSILPKPTKTSCCSFVGL